MTSQSGRFGGEVGVWRRRRRGVHVARGGGGGSGGGGLLAVGRVQQVRLLLLPLPTAAGTKNWEIQLMYINYFLFPFDLSQWQEEINSNVKIVRIQQVIGGTL